MNQKFKQTQIGKILKDLGISFFYPLEEIGAQVTRQDTQQVTQQVTRQDTQQVTGQVELMDRIASTLKYCEKPRPLKEIMAFLNLRNRNNFMEKVLYPLLEKGYLNRNIPDKPSNRFQKYVAVKKEGENNGKNLKCRQRIENESKI